jgi:sec-independent protein translocase protein TatA
MVIIAKVILLLFGRGKISGLMGEVAGGIKAFRKGLREDPGRVAPGGQRGCPRDARGREGQGRLTFDAQRTTGNAVRGQVQGSGGIFSRGSLEQRVPADHPLRMSATLLTLR